MSRVRAPGGALEELFLRTWEPWGRFFFCAAKPVPQNRMHPGQAKPGRQKTNLIVETQLIDNAIAETEEEYERTGILLDAKETLAGLRRRHFG
ncbi:MAG TPA: hypothetical protein DCZ40_01870 [Lachnospiraceae bacterium]|nr:hypothetical protein [Lachnospiraceae bacterium]